MDDEFLAILVSSSIACNTVPREDHQNVPASIEFQSLTLYSSHRKMHLKAFVVGFSVATAASAASCNPNYWDCGWYLAGSLGELSNQIHGKIKA